MKEFDQDDPRHIEERNNRKLTADKICQILSKVKNNPSSSAKRWVWELVQNAKDVPNIYDRVAVQIELTDNDLLFRHNGDPFSLQNIFSLIQQVSSKDSANEDAEVTGKFGTGFIATHLLSEVIYVSGVVAHKEVHRQFQLELDRSGGKSEDMLPKIDSALDKAHQIEDDAIYPQLANFEDNRSEKDLDTVFRYPLRTEERKKAAQAGIDDLVNTLPLTLVNIPKIKSVEIIVHQAERSTEIYKSEIVEDTANYSKITVLHDGGAPRNFVVYKGNDLLLTAEVSDFNEMEMIETFGKTPNLYRDFPLIGSEKFYFPFIINGQKFNPTEDRDGILLHAVEAADAEENRGIIECAFDSAKEFTQWLIANGAKNRYICAYSRLPNEDWEEGSKKWYQELQEDYRTFLLKQDVVETATGIGKLEDCRIPTCGNTDDHKLSFHNLVTPFLGRSRVPSEDIALEWIKFTGPKEELESWEQPIRYDLESFLEDLSALTTLEALSEKLDGESSAIEWLNRVYAFIIEIKETEKLDEYKILPNQNGEFQHLSDLYLESKLSPIPDEFLNILNYSFQLDWRSDLIHREVQLSGQNIEQRDLSDLSQTLNEFLFEKDRNNYGGETDAFLKREGRLATLTDILRLVHHSSTREDFRCRIFKFGTELFGADENLVEVNNVEGFNFDRALRLFIYIINEKIEHTENLVGLGLELGEGKNALAWLNAYLSCLEGKSDFQNELETGNIIPNRLGHFCAHEDIRAFGTVETPLNADLIAILSDLDNEEHWNSFLLADGITLSFPSKTFSELGDAVDLALKNIEDEEPRSPGTLESKKGPILDLLNWCKNNEDLATRYLKHVKSRQDPLWVHFTLDAEIFNIIREPENLDLLKQIASTGISAERVKELVGMASELEKVGVDGLQKMLEHGSDLLEERQNFEYLKTIGEEVEAAFKDALESEGLDVQIDHVGKGSFDFSVQSNKDASKRLFIEMKSYVYGSSRDFKFANSQILRSEQEGSNYIVCTLERPEDNASADADYIRDQLKGFSQLHTITRPVLQQIETYEELKSTRTGIRLVLDELGAPRVHVPHNIIRSQSYDFESLIGRIKEILLG